LVAVVAVPLVGLTTLVAVVVVAAAAVFTY
jgi:hypothetical protein